MKRIMSLFIVFLFVVSFLPVSAAGNTFTDDFSSGLGKWINPNLDDRVDTEDSECDVISIKDGALYMDNQSTGGSFAFISPKDLMWSDFEMSARVRFEKPGGWFGFSVRKDDYLSARFNSCNNVMIYIVGGGGVAALRGYPGGTVKDLEGKMVNPMPKDVLKDHIYKLVVKGSKYELFVDDVLTYTLEYTDKTGTLPEEGFISLNACTAKVYFDDISIKPPSEEKAIAPVKTEAPASNTANSTEKKNTSSNPTAKPKEPANNTVKTTEEGKSADTSQIKAADNENKDAAEDTDASIKTPEQTEDPTQAGNPTSDESSTANADSTNTAESVEVSSEVASNAESASVSGEESNETKASNENKSSFPVVPVVLGSIGVLAVGGGVAAYFILSRKR